jgi:hypothetical protein
MKKREIPTFTNGFAAVTIASSTSNGEITSPPLLIISFERPVIYKYPSSSICPMSPESNHPSLVNADVSSGTDGSGDTSYPANVGSPRTQIAPVLPDATGCSRLPGLRMERCGPHAMPEHPGRSSWYVIGGDAMGMHLKWKQKKKRRAGIGVSVRSKERERRPKRRWERRDRRLRRRWGKKTHSVMPYEGRITASNVDLRLTARDGRRPPAALAIMRMRRSRDGTIPAGCEDNIAW